MAIMRFNYRSEALGMDTNVTVCYPTNSLTIYADRINPSANSDFPQSAKYEYKNNMKFQTIWFLHGGGDDDTTPYRYTSLERYAEENQVMLVTPLAHGTMYTDTVSGLRYTQYITQELPLVIRSLFASSDKREDNFIMGSAMGGNGALGIGLSNPQLYSAVVDLSGGIGLTVDREVYKQQMSWMGGAMRNIFRDVDSFENTEHDLYYVAKNLIEKGGDIPKIFIGVGENDFIRYRVEKDYLGLKALGYDVYYEEGRNVGHDWDFWDMYFEKALSQWLPLKRKPLYE